MSGISVLVAVLLTVRDDQNSQIIDWHRKKWQKPRRYPNDRTVDPSSFYDPLEGVMDGDENQPLDLVSDEGKEEN